MYLGNLLRRRQSFKAVLSTCPALFRDDQDFHVKSPASNFSFSTI